MRVSTAAKITLPFLKLHHLPSRPTHSLSSPLSHLRLSPNPLSVISSAYNHRRFSLIRVITMSTTTGGSDYSNSESSNADDYLAVFALSPTSLLKIDKGDITRWSVDGTSDAIVNAANERMLGGGGVDGAIHRAAGPELREACYEVPQVEPGVRCPTGEARITPGFRLPASHVIHTVGPIYDEDENPEALLENAYRNSLAVAKENNIQYIAFPAISCGVYGYPYDEAANVAISTVKKFTDDFKEIHFVLFSDEIYDPWIEKAKELVGEDLSTMIVDEEKPIKDDQEDRSEKIVGEAGSEKIVRVAESEKIAEEGSEKVGSDEGSEKIGLDEGSEKIGLDEGLEKTVGKEGPKQSLRVEGSVSLH